jgi:ABC-type transport system involved in multi-copper enzyme maturation permease subunit
LAPVAGPETLRAPIRMLFTSSLRFLPVVERELRIAARGKGAYRWRTIVVGVGLGVMALLAALQSAANAPANAQGISMFRALVTLAACYAFLSSAFVTADSVSREKREGTLGLLFLTDLRGKDIILGKLAANSLNTVYGLLGLLPLLAIPVMMGGVSIQAGVIAALSIVNLLFVSLALGMFVSSLSWDERRASFAAIVSGLALMLGPPMLSGIGVFFGRHEPMGMVIACFSPLFPLIGGMTLQSVAHKLMAMAPSHLIGWLLLAQAGRLAQKAWHSRSGNPVKRTIDERVFTPRNPAARARHRRKALDIHPLVWLLERHPGKRFYADILVLAIIVIWIWGYRSFGSDMFGGPGWFLIAPLAFTVHMILASWVIAESSMRVLQDRRSGALELLLCTSLTDREIVDGHRMTLRRLFLRPVLLLAVAEVFVAFNGFGHENDAAARNGRWLMLGMALAIILDMHALSWIGLWLATSLPNVNRIGACALAITPLGPAVASTILVTLIQLTLPNPSRFPFWAGITIWVAMFATVDLLVGQVYCRRAVRKHFRESAMRVQPVAAMAS